MISLNPIYCLNCKTALDDTAVFCVMCGRDQRLSANVAEGFGLTGRNPHGFRHASGPQTIATVATIVGTGLIVPIIVYCVWKHPFVCLLAIAVGVLPLSAFFYRQFRRHPVIPAAIACCLCLFCNQVVDKIHETRAEARSERLAVRDVTTGTTPAIAAPRSLGAAPAIDVTPAVAQTRQRRFPRGAFGWMRRRRMNRQVGQGSRQPRRKNEDNSLADGLRRDLGQQLQSVSQGADVGGD